MSYAPDDVVRLVETCRFPTNPLIDAGSSPTLGDNINGPSVIRTPDWLPDRLGAYYMYFAHHSGTHIRLAHADRPEGPWRVHDPGTLHLDSATAFHDHIASPDVHVDEATRTIRMYFHGPVRGRPGQWTGVAHSRDGRRFEAKPDVLGKFYFRVWSWQGRFYALAKNDNEGWGELYRSHDGVGGFESRGNFLKDVRHSAVLVRGDHLLIFYSRVGDAPERILVTSVDLRSDWRDWQPAEPVEVLRPELAYEGIEFLVAPSRHGSASRVCELRDPCIFEDADGELFLFYSVAGEMGIAGARCRLG